VQYVKASLQGFNMYFEGVSEFITICKISGIYGQAKITGESFNSVQNEVDKMVEQSQ
jgi:hypothetical protein